MLSPRHVLRTVSRHGLRRFAADALRTLTPRGAFALHTTDGALVFGARSALAMGWLALPLTAAGRPDLAVYAMLGSFTTTFGRNLPYARRARALALVAVAMTACVGCGSALGVWARPWEGGAGDAVVVVATAVVAALAKLACDATRLSGLGAVMLLFSFAVAANDPSVWADVLPQTALAAAGAVSAWALGTAGWLLHPDRPQRLALAAALRAVADLLAAPSEAAAGRARHLATRAVLDAHHSLGLVPATEPLRRNDVSPFVRLSRLSWSLLVGSARHELADPAGTALLLRRQARILTDRRRRPPLLLPELPWPPVPEHEGQGLSADGSSRTPVARRAAELLGRRRPGIPGHLAVLAVPALRMGLGTAAAGGLAVFLDLRHGYWAAISAAAVLHSVNLRTTAQRAVQRTVGTVLGVLLALAVLATHPAPVALATVIVLMEFLLEYIVVRNYALGVVFITPIALLLSDLAEPVPAGGLAYDRLLGSLLGIVVGLLCATVVVHDHAALRTERALDACRRCARRADSALRARSEPPAAVEADLAAAVVELRDADDAAAGELWPAGLDPAEVAAAEERAYALLEQLHGRPWT
ncbi:FUSC family protein [Streptomyces sp. Babs14]|uniref:FUSC family protein n=1 Tax=unclassified Streptomyces TaxID=2593676 RepID=UPI001C2252AB|nr:MULTISPECIES: FUSC family protein [unclassified Streptomyces]MBU8547597.1 FUSC family protein [Streptomyces sp. Osf17]MBU8554365.1 FUSC family protein [Streptomyces sp. Babs14]